MLRLLQSLLADRFKLAVRRETKDLVAYAREVEGPSFYSLDLVIRDATFRTQSWQDAIIADLAWRLASLTILEDHVVVDKTGLDGHQSWS